VIETERLVLRRQRADDAAAYRELWTERDPRVPPHRRIEPDGRPTVEDVAARIRADMAESALLTITRTLEGDVIGYCGLRFEGNGSAGEPELAYELLRRAQGFGYATEAAQAIVAWAAETGYERLWAGVRVWNVESRNVLRKLGFVESGQVEADAEFGDSLLMVKSCHASDRSDR
jgi:[ribosomal protein S5]-alanine N-acetyltransferase